RFALQRGPSAPCCFRSMRQRHPVCPLSPYTALFRSVKSSSEALSIMAANFYDKPPSKLKLVGVTGTNGKTTTASILFNLFSKLEIGRHTSELQSRENAVCRLPLAKKQRTTSSWRSCG